MCQIMDQNTLLTQTKGQTLLEPIKTSSVHMPKYPQTIGKVAIHLVHEELQ
jgi:hypothetical protein